LLENSMNATGILYTNPAATSVVSRPDLWTRYRTVRAETERLCQGLAAEDHVVQSMPDVSPTKWHLAHTSWFFENFVLLPHLSGYRSIDPIYAHLFNSYYVQAGERHCRARRGYLSRPTVAEIVAYRSHVDDAMETLIGGLEEEKIALLHPWIELGLHHEQQHQELILTDIKHVFSVNPLRPVFSERQADPGSSSADVEALRWFDHPENLHWIGGHGEGFAFDNEGPRHREFVHGFQIASRLVTNREYLEFIEDGGYRRAELWLSMGWATAEANGWREPFYWERHDGRIWTFTLSGMRELEPDEPVCHLSYFEADAFARWAGARLPTEAEWEVAAAGRPVQGNLLESNRLHPSPLRQEQSDHPLQLFGDVWEWTRSPYSPYPGFAPAPGAVGEYNGKFMCNQFVLRGGSCVTPGSHIRATYRNFFPPETCWQFTGLRLARDL